MSGTSHNFSQALGLVLILLKVGNTLSCNSAVLITAVKVFIVHAFSACANNYVLNVSQVMSHNFIQALTLDLILLKVGNTLSCNSAVLITAVKAFIVHAFSACANNYVLNVPQLTYHNLIQALSLGFILLKVRNALSYNSAVLITAVKVFILQAFSTCANNYVLNVPQLTFHNYIQVHEPAP